MVFAYNPKPQLSGMRVHTLPIGSKSTLQKTKGSQKAKKDEAAEPATKDNKRKHEEEVAEEDKSSKKKKKKQDK